jgi:tetratricopeptide (TPR) repeat protein
MTVNQKMQQAVVHHQAGRLPQAEALYREVLAENPNFSDAWHLMGLLARRVGKTDVAAEMISRAIHLNPNVADYHNNIGIVLMTQKKLDHAIAALEHAIQLSPGYADAHNNLSAAFRETGKLDEAVEAARRAIQFKPDFAQAYGNLGNALLDRKKYTESIAALSTAVQLQPSLVDALYNLGNALQNADRLSEAQAAYEKAISFSPDHLKAHNNLGNVFRQMVKVPQAIDAYSKAISLDPNHAEAHWNRSLAYLLSGDFERGWPEYEWRQQCESFFARRLFAEPKWNGEPLEGRTILLHSEQGLGDTLQFVRYVPMVAARGGKVILQCQDEVRRLLARVSSVEAVYLRDEPLPPFDVQCALMSLPMVFNTRLDSIPAIVPYISADPNDIAKWVSRLPKAESGRRIGLAWAGRPTHENDRRRSLALSQLSPLFSVPGLQFVSLQKGPAAEQTKSVPPDWRLTDPTAQIEDLADTAALISQLDLVIAVDTSVAHLAGVMGKPVWVLLPFDPDWRWLLNRNDSPWYPTMRLFRQSTAGDWTGVIQRVADALRDIG